MVAKTLNVLGWIVGLSLLVLGVARMALPIDTIPGSGALNATQDSETRAGGALLIGVGYAYIWAVRQPRIPVHLLRVLALVMAALVLSRLISAVVVGMPHPIFIVAAGVEFVAAVLTLVYSTMGDDAETRQLGAPR